MHLTSRWFVRPGREAEAAEALSRLVADVRAQEPETLVYMVHMSRPDDGELQSLPPADPASVLFFEVYRDVQAFQRHLNGPAFQGFVTEHGGLFVAANGRPFTVVEFLTMRDGFIRPGQKERAAGAGAVAPNRHPAVMFEVMAKDQKRLLTFYRQVFGWDYVKGTGDFAYVKFPVESLPLLGGIGQANPTEPGFQAGRNFYLLVDDLAETIAKVTRAGGSEYVPRTSIDGYEFAMIKDPEENVVGLMKPFKS